MSDETKDLSSENTDNFSIPSLGKSISPQKAQKLVDRYGDRLMALARKRISPRLASRVDPEDIVQSVFRTFFRRVKENKFSIADHDDLIRLLMRITVHKTLRQVAYHKAAKRDPSAETPQGEEHQERMLQVLDEEPTPEAVNVFADQMEHFFAKLKPEERQILEMRMEGHSNEEIAEKLGTYDRKIRRIAERIRALAEKEGLGPQ